MTVTNMEYDKMTKEKIPPSKVWTNSFKAFVSGGIICALGQLLFNLYSSLGVSADIAKSAVSCSLIFISAIFTALGIFDKVARHAGAGVLVPITGFANAVVSPAMEFYSEGLILGTCAKMFSIAGSVIVCGTGASLLYGLIIWIFKLA